MRKPILAMAMLALTQQAFAGGLPPPSRTVYKCEEAGKVHYSDSPCLGAKKVDVTPTRGLDKSSGRELTGADAQRERQREQFSDAVRPITGMDPQQFQQAGRRMKLSADAQRQCQVLDRTMPGAEDTERRAQGTPDLKAAQLSLYKLRKQHRDLGCE